VKPVHRLTAIIEREGDGYVALSPELDIASQGDTIEEARRNLVEALELFFETADPAEVRERLRGEVYVTRLEVAVGSTYASFPGVKYAGSWAGTASSRCGSVAVTSSCRSGCTKLHDHRSSSGSLRAADRTLLSIIRQSGLDRALFEE
jgi:predicted RNase H-like HicB family nuclease